MPIKTICLEWFRGAADEVCLATQGKSVVVYGPNGAGKSCFVDSVEYITNDCKIGHLSHEYSGKKQEKGLSNTSIPADKHATIGVKLTDDTEQRAEIDSKGGSVFSGTPSDDLRSWNYRRIVLRQDEVADFIKETKKDKYSALLPLLGLESLEIAAENLRQLSRKIEIESDVRGKKAQIAQIKDRQLVAEKHRPLTEALVDLDALYGSADDQDANFTERAARVLRGVREKIDSSSKEQRRHVLLQQVAGLDFATQTETIREANEKLVAAVEPQVEERLGILSNVSTLLGDVAGDELPCPACGQMVRADTFREHVKAEEFRLREVAQIFAERRAGINRFCDLFVSLQRILKSPELNSWRDGLNPESLADLEVVNVDDLRQSWRQENLAGLIAKITPVAEAAKDAELNAPADSQKLAADERTAVLSLEVVQSDVLQAEVNAAEALLTLIMGTGRSIRDQIKKRAQAVIGAISADIQKFWAILHPEVTIEDVCLYLPEADKAIDIHLKFYGKEQDSPRLTLSEGYRNSLGLCIFLAMVKFEGNSDQPIVLDDVVVSLDRTHRGMIAKLLDDEFSDYQVLVFTHDREWYTELHYLLPEKTWTFKVLLPYDKPEIGIRWSTKTTTFEEARALLDTRPDAAGNDARKIMDTELALIAEKLELKLPFLRGEKNDHRMAHDFASALISAGRQCFEKQEGANYVKKEAAIELAERTDKKLLAWGNRGSHTHSLVKAEAAELLDSCEATLQQFTCAGCAKKVWVADVAGKHKQCQCGAIRWRYDKDK
jgi:energy-coupling factor transporter ATP-binding protein EcfA2